MVAAFVSELGWFPAALNSSFDQVQSSTDIAQHPIVPFKHGFVEQKLARSFSLVPPPVIGCTVLLLSHFEYALPVHNVVLVAVGVEECGEE